ncbi:hypothetical protein DDJ66_22105 [Klebsiella oxytoca]|nr:hypothetical protein DDJ34_20180 [Klebsiella oxytoca]RFP46502.1 hypothetical protein DDJ66_22105 [Klebsiella oxytoca]RFP48932.1 hypothetical protein DDJ69_20340 [Klebsiella oxytoca]TYF96466.1 hypothetical protein DJ542_00560 [Klebsiella grimontii]
MFVASPDKDIGRVAKRMPGHTTDKRGGLRTYPIRAILFASLALGSAQSPHVLRVRSGSCALSVCKLSATITPVGIGSTPTRIKKGADRARRKSRRGAAARKCGVTGARWRQRLFELPGLLSPAG